jgi:hypothetical protein
MHKREITLADGRYLVFYTFEGDAAESPHGPEQPLPATDADPESAAGPPKRGEKQ